MAHDYEIGTSFVGLDNLADLTPPVPEPKSDFNDFSEYLSLGNGTVRGAGWTTAEWRWTYLSRARRDEMKTFCPGASAEVFIQTRNNDGEDTYEVYTAIMVWPIDEEKSYSQRMDFVIRFQNLEVYTP